jgi:thiosulfate reductase cytochrome b subunit
MPEETPTPTPMRAPVRGHDLIVRKHHALVRVTHWANIPILLGLILSGLSIYWAAPVYQRPSNPATGSTDYLADLGRWVTVHIPGQKSYARPGRWFYDHASLGTGMLAEALRLHWVFAYLFMANGALYLAGLLLGGGFKALLPRFSDVPGSFRMLRYYLGLVPAKLLRRPWPHPPVTEKYNPLQKLGYLSMPAAGAVAIASGWAMHKPVQLSWLERLFGNYDHARQVHFWLLWLFVAFAVPHVVLVVADGWDTFRSMVAGWSGRIRGEEHG